MNSRTLAICSLLLAWSGAVASDSPGELPDISDYAWGFPVQTVGEHDFYSVTLPLEFNQSVSDPQMRDAGVYDARGNPVPRVIESIGKTATVVEHVEALPVMAINSQKEQSPEGLRLLLDHQGDRTELELNIGGGMPAAPESLPLAYLVDARGLASKIDALELSWAPIDPGFIAQIIVEGSNDLNNWTELGSGAVAFLEQDTARIERRRVSVSGDRHDFLRIRGTNLPSGWALTDVEAIRRNGVDTSRRAFITLDAASRDQADGGFIFELGGAPDVERVGLVLPDANTVVHAEISVWQANSEHWRPVYNGQFYRLGRGDDSLQSDPVTIRQTRAERWKVVLRRGSTMTPPRLELGWRPDTLLFVAQGEGPYTLATGRARDHDEHYPQDRIMGDRALIVLARKNGPPGMATLGPRYPLGGSDLLQVATPIDWQTVALWIALILGVLAVIVMAVRVLRELGRETR
ncbi:MAG: DUF3999 family protein [Gammaproteobacteria bacterium]